MHYQDNYHLQVQPKNLAAELKTSVKYFVCIYKDMAFTFSDLCLFDTSATALSGGPRVVGKAQVSNYTQLGD